jgi:two-component system, OmpR family, response regulator
MKLENEKTLVSELDDYLKKLMLVPSYKVGAYIFDVDKRMLTFNDESFKLTAKESYLLVLFAANINKLLDRNDILNAIWREDNYRTRRTMDVFICKLRKLLNKDSSIVIINTHGKGYKMYIA